MYEQTSKTPDRLIFEYDFPEPVNKVTIIYTQKADRYRYFNALEKAEVRIGDQGALELPKEVINCIPHPSVENATFNFTGYGIRSKAWRESWWSDGIEIDFPFGEDSSLFPSYPSIAFRFKELKLKGIDIYNSSGERREIDLSKKGCPRGDIDWALEKK